MVNITEVNQIADLITPFDSFHKVFEILWLILSLGTTWWQFMPAYGTFEAENLWSPRTFFLDLPEGCQYAESTRFVPSLMAGSTLDQGNANRMRYILMTSSTSAWDAYLAYTVVSEGIYLL
jgi:hypothetical protein